MVSYGKALIIFATLTIKVLFRTDASLQIGTGHVMRCLTLANALREHGAECRFVSREHPGNLLEWIRKQGFEAVALPVQDDAAPAAAGAGEPTLAHAYWLGTDWFSDAQQTQLAMGQQAVDWMVVDHYSLDARWERVLRPHCRKLLVIDDIADREHICDVLLDQNMVEFMNERYKSKVPEICTCLLGPKYALLRPEFSQLRSASIARRATPRLEHLLIFLGGSDANNETAKVIEGVKLANRKWLHIDVVVGQSFPALDILRKQLASLPMSMLHIQTSGMAQLMLDADLAITSGGSVTWEKCALGLPSLVVIQGDNQHPIATRMHELGAQRTLGISEKLTPTIYAHALDAILPNDLIAMSQSAQAVCDGSGIEAVMHTMEIST